MQSIASLVMGSKVPGVQRLASVLDSFSNPATIPLEDCNILGGHGAWARFFRSGEMSLLNTKRLADFIGCPMSLLMPPQEKKCGNCKHHRVGGRGGYHCGVRDQVPAPGMPSRPLSISLLLDACFMYSPNTELTGAEAQPESSGPA